MDLARRAVGSVAHRLALEWVGMLPQARLDVLLDAGEEGEVNPVPETRSSFHGDVVERAGVVHALVVVVAEGPGAGEGATVLRVHLPGVSEPA